MIYGQSLARLMVGSLVPKIKRKMSCDSIASTEVFKYQSILDWGFVLNCNYALYLKLSAVHNINKC